MPLTKIQFAPGIDKQNTEYGAEGRWTDSDLVVGLNLFLKH